MVIILTRSHNIYTTCTQAGNYRTVCAMVHVQGMSQLRRLD